MKLEYFDMIYYLQFGVLRFAFCIDIHVDIDIDIGISSAVRGWSEVIVGLAEWRTMIIVGTGLPENKHCAQAGIYQS